MDFLDLINTPLLQLSEEEKKFIQENSTLDEFERLQALELNIKSNISNTEYPSSHIKDNLLTMFRENHSAEKSKKNLFNYPLEFWKVAAILLVFFGATYFLVKTNQLRTNNILAKETLTDTVVVYKNIVRIDTIIDTRYIKTLEQKNTTNTNNDIKPIALIKEPKPENASMSILKVFDLNDLKPNYNHSSKHLNEDSLEDRIGYIQL